MCALLVVSGQLQANDFPDTPDNHWAYETLARCKAAGLVTGMPARLLRGNYAYSRRDMATFTIHACVSYDSVIDDSAGGVPRVSTDPVRRIFEPDTAKRLLGLGEPLERLVSTFTPEMPSWVSAGALKAEVARHHHILVVTVRDSD